jgi:hypothetical protein
MKKSATTAMTRCQVIRLVLLLVAAVWLCPSRGFARLTATKLGDSTVDTKALTIKGSFGPAINGTSFQQDAVITHGRHQYVGYYDAGRKVCLARRKLPNEEWEVVRFPDYDFRSNDSHNTISVGICPKDGTIHLAFDHHGHPLHYRASNKGVATDPEGVKWESSLFGGIVSELEKGNPVRGMTYPRFWQTPDGGLQFCYRRGGSGNGDRMLVDYNPQNGTWHNTRQIDSRKGTYQNSNSRCSYPNGYTYGPDGNLHTTWVWREGGGSPNHDLMYACSEDRGTTWLNNAGRKLDRPPHLHSPGITVVPISPQYGLMNTHGQAVDSQGRIHVVMWHCTKESLKGAGSKPGQLRWGPPEARRYHHYWRDKDASWHHVELPGIAGTRPKLFIDKNNNACVICSDSWSRGLFHPAGNLHILAATPETGWRDWKLIHLEEGPFVNEMLGDPYRWKNDGILSVMVQASPEEPHQPTPLRILDFALEEK